MSVFTNIAPELLLILRFERGTSKFLSVAIFQHSNRRVWDQARLKKGLMMNETVMLNIAEEEKHGFCS